MRIRPTDVFQKISLWPEVVHSQRCGSKAMENLSVSDGGHMVKTSSRCLLEHLGRILYTNLIKALLLCLYHPGCGVGATFL